MGYSFDGGVGNAFYLRIVAGFCRFMGIRPIRTGWENICSFEDRMNHRRKKNTSLRSPCYRISEGENGENPGGRGDVVAAQAVRVPRLVEMFVVLEDRGEPQNRDVPITPPDQGQTSQRCLANSQPV